MKQTYHYASSIDGLAPLYADAVFRADGEAKPLVAVLHGFHCTRGHVGPDCEALAGRGFFCVAPDMRGHADSAGKHDCGGLQICDIADALAEAVRRWPGEIDAANVDAVGYSGGGGNVMSLFAKFPTLLNAGAAFFGISDYAAWHRSMGRPDCNATMEKALGGTPDDVPERYAARASLPAVQNNPRTRLHLFWDAEETACPPMLDEQFVCAARALGYTNVTPHLSKPGDPARWIHGYRSEVRDLYAADDIFAPDFASAGPPYVLPTTGELVVCGYIVTDRFAIWLGDGLEGTARVHYSLSGGMVSVRELERTGRAEMRVMHGPTIIGWKGGLGLGA